MCLNASLFTPILTINIFKTDQNSISEFFKHQVHTNSTESFWAILKRGYQGVYRKMSRKHLNRYVSEYGGCRNIRELNKINQTKSVATVFKTQRLIYERLTA